MQKKRLMWFTVRSQILSETSVRYEQCTNRKVSLSCLLGTDLMPSIYVAFPLRTGGGKKAYRTQPIATKIINLNLSNSKANTSSILKPKEFLSQSYSQCSPGLLQEYVHQTTKHGWIYMTDFFSQQPFRAATAVTTAIRSPSPWSLASSSPATLKFYRLLSSETRAAIDKAVESAPVVLFMKGTPETPQCGFSRASIQILGLQGVDPKKFTAFNVLEDPELRQGIYSCACSGSRVID